MLKAFKYRLYPTTKQTELLNKHFGCCRFVYNLALETKSYAYTVHRKNISCYELMKQVTVLRKENEWLREVSADALAQSIFDLDNAYMSFLKGKTKYPRYKSKRSNTKFRIPHGRDIKIKNNKIYILKFKEGIKFVQDRSISGTIKSCTVSKTPTGKYFVSVLCETRQHLPVSKIVDPTTTIGIDLGIKSFIVTSYGHQIDNPKHFNRALIHLKYLQRQQSKKNKGGANKKKAAYKLALQHERVVNKRKDFLHKLSTNLIKSHDTICCEKLNIVGMVKNRKLSQGISSSGWGMFVEMLKYKAEWNGKNILQIPSFEPSTKICSQCNAVNDTLTLKDREWLCIECGTLHDRDINAAINIKNYCLKNYGGEPHRQKSVELPATVGAVKQKGKLIKK